MSAGARIRGLTVDLDDTLYPQADWLAGAWSAVARRGADLGLPEPALHAALLDVCANGSDRGRIVDRALLSLGVAPDPYVSELVAVFLAHRPGALEPYPGVRPALERLRGRLPVVVVTDGVPAVQHAKVAALGLDALVADVVVSDELGGRAARKPHPAAFRRALQVLGLPASAVVHVGDRPDKDVRGAAALGMLAVRVLTGEYAGAAGDGTAWRTVPDFAAAVEACLAECAVPLAPL